MKVNEEKIAYCKKLYIEQNGKDHYLIEKSMREVGYSFTRRCLYRNGKRPGWIVRYGFKKELSVPPLVRCPSVVKENDITNNTEQRDPMTLSFEYWLKATSPQFTWDWAYQKLLYDKLRDVTAGKTKRLMIFLPPRHGKSELITVRYSAWRLQKDPSLNIIVGSYNQKLANRFSRKIKNVLHDATSRRVDERRGVELRGELLDL